LVDGALKFRGGPAAITGPPSTIDQTLATFKKWLLLRDPVPIYAAFGTVAANLLPGDPVWLGLIGPPSSAKTEILNSLSKLPNVVQCNADAAGRSAAHRKQHAPGARGACFGRSAPSGSSCARISAASYQCTPRRRPRSAALREVYDGAWTRHVGTDGGRTLTWEGKVGLLFAATGAIDSHHGVIGSMGDRFLLSRIVPRTLVNLITPCLRRCSDRPDA
jgi:hypothetical protein